MLEKLIQYSAENRFLILLLTLCFAAAGIYATVNTPIDALPDLSDVQVIIKTDYAGQGPQIVEEQVTYPLASALMSVPFAKTVRGYSMFGTSFVYVIFEDGTDLYWARSRVLEYLNYVSNQMPAGVKPAIGPDATGVGWIYEYSLVDKTGQHDLAELRALQDFFVKFELQAIDGVSEIATVGGFKKQYQVVVDPQKLDAYNLSISHVQMALKKSNQDVGGRLIELGEREFIIRGKGYLRGLEDIREVPLKVVNGSPVTIGDVANVHLGPEIRRGIADKNGEGEVVGGIVVMRYGENAQAVIDRVKVRLEEIKSGLPAGVEIVPEYDRSPLIQRAVSTLTTKIWEEIVVVALIVLIFLMHVRSAFVAVITVPVGILIGMLIMYLLDINANIMSLGGIAIAIGVMVDASLVMVENAHKHLERANDKLGRTLTESERFKAVVDAAKEVGPSLFFSLLIVTVSFLPVFSLEQVEGRLFRPLALTKTFAMATASILAVTLVPALMTIFIRGKIRTENQNPIARFFIWAYRPMIKGALKYPKSVLLAGLTILIVSILPIQKLVLGTEIIPFAQIGSEFMPALNEGDLLYMPTTLPGVSPQKAKELLQQTDRIIKAFPEVENVFGKIGRAETATDPAPLSMIETTITLKPKDEWREGTTVRSLIQELNAAIQIPGVTNAWTMPIRARIDMLATGIRTPVGIKIAGPDLTTLEHIGIQVEALLRPVEGTQSVYSERVMGGTFLDFNIDRVAAARYGLTTSEVQSVITSAIGGMKVTTTVEGLERFSVNVRYPRELRDNIPALKRILVSTPAGAQVPLGQLTDLKLVAGPPMIKSENARPNAWVFIDLKQGQDVGGYVTNAREIVAENIELPAGYSLVWSGQYEYIQRSSERLSLLIPLTILIVFLLLYLHFRSVTEALLLLVPLPFAVVGAVWLMAWLDYDMSIAVGVGLIAVAGLAAETSVVMFVYLDEAVRRYTKEGRLYAREKLNDAIEEGAVDRVRPKLMTVFTTIIGLLPVMFGTETGSEVMKRIATPMVGGLVTSTVNTLIMIPALYAVVKAIQYRKKYPNNKPE